MNPDKKCSRRGGIGYGLIAVGVALAVLLPGFTGWAVASVPQKKILILFPLEENIPAFTAFNANLRAVLAASPDYHFDFYSENLDLRRFSDDLYYQKLVELFRVKYAKLNIDLIIALTSGALDFLVKHGAELFPDTPVVFFETDSRQLAGHVRPPGIPVITGKVEIAKTLGVALELHPDTREVVVISGASQEDRALAEAARNDFQGFADRVEFTPLAGLPMEELLERVSGLPAHSILFYVCVLEDGKGRTFIPRDALAAISSQASVPVYGALGTYLGHGIVGGWLYSYELQGTRTAQWALRLLGGEAPADLPGVDAGGSETLFDWRELQRWGISEAKLPPGSTVRYKPLSAWDLYKWRIIGMMSLLAVQALLILGLVIQLRRRRRAESSLRESEERMSLALSSADLFLWEWDIPGDRIWATERARAFYGFHKDAELSIEVFLNALFPEDREPIRDTLQRIFQEKQPDYRSEYRIVRPDGTVRWVAGLGQCHFDAQGTPLRLLGVSMDITERRQAEETLRQSEAQLRTSREELRELAGRLLQAEEEERRRLARELHDDLTQRLAVLAIETGKLEMTSQRSPELLVERLKHIRSEMVRLSTDVHGLSRRLHPSILDDLGLVKAVQAECISFQQREGLPVRFTPVNVPAVIPGEISLTLYRVIQEGLRNIAKHAEAKGVRLDLTGDGDALELFLEDDGNGFDPKAVHGKPGLGLASMSERVRLIRGKLAVDSRPGKGTVLHVRASVTGREA